MSKKTVELLQTINHKNQTTYLPNEITKLIEAVSKEVLKIQEKGNELVFDEADLMGQLNKKENPSIHVSLDRALILSTSFASTIVLGATGVINPAVFIPVGVFSTFFSVFMGLLFVTGTKVSMRDLENPGWLYKLQVKLSPRISKKYRLAQEHYRDLTLKLEEYRRYYEKKMELIQPALEVINNHLDGTVLSIDEKGQICSKLSAEAEIRSTIINIVSSNAKPAQLSVSL